MSPRALEATEENKEGDSELDVLQVSSNWGSPSWSHGIYTTR